MRDAVLGHPEHALEIDAHDAVPLRTVRLQHGPVLVLPEDARVVVQNVEGTEAARPLLDHSLHVLLDGHVTNRGDGLASCLLDEGHRLVRRLLVDVAHHDARALLGEEHRSLASHPHPRAGDQRDLTLEPGSHADPSSPLLLPLPSGERAGVRGRWRPPGPTLQSPSPLRGEGRGEGLPPPPLRSARTASRAPSPLPTDRKPAAPGARDADSASPPCRRRPRAPPGNAPARPRPRATSWAPGRGWRPRRRCRRSTSAA